MNEERLALINRFTRKPLDEKEVYTFDVILCDNEIDRDNERFTKESLDTLAKLFIGRTGIFNHNPKGENQTARIYDTKVVTDESRMTKAGEKYSCLRASAYMVKTDSNNDLIKEIDGGIKKEVSVSCSVAHKLCSVCGNDISKSPCQHKKGRIYNGVRCHTLLCEPTDAYEWSFVAVPAQKNAGVTKHFENYEDSGESVPQYDDELEYIREELGREVRSLSFLTFPQSAHKAVERIAGNMTVKELVALRNELRESAQVKTKAQTFVCEENSDVTSPFQL